MVSSEAILASAHQFYHSIETPAYVWLEDENPHEAAVGAYRDWRRGRAIRKLLGASALSELLPNAVVFTDSPRIVLEQKGHLDDPIIAAHRKPSFAVGRHPTPISWLQLTQRGAEGLRLKP